MGDVVRELQWTHAQCRECWDKWHPDKEPFAFRDPQEELCCFCNKRNRSGIYVRHDPKDDVLTCNGEHNRR